MVKMRLRRVGAKKQPFYRVIVADERSPRNGRFIEEIGYYNPLTEPATVKIDADKAKEWIKNGAQPTETVKSVILMEVEKIVSDIAKAIVDTPDEVSVTRTDNESDGSIELLLTVAPDETGMVIGRHGKIAKAIRTVVKAASAGSGRKVTVEIK